VGCVQFNKGWVEPTNQYWIPEQDGPTLYPDRRTLQPDPNGDERREHAKETRKWKTLALRTQVFKPQIPQFSDFRVMSPAYPLVHFGSRESKVLNWSKQQVDEAHDPLGFGFADLCHDPIIGILAGRR